MGQKDALGLSGRTRGVGDIGDLVSIARRLDARRLLLGQPGIVGLGPRRWLIHQEDVLQHRRECGELGYLVGEIGRGEQHLGLRVSCMIWARVLRWARVVVGVTVAPARRAPSMASTKRWSFLTRTATWSPSPIPSARRPLATRSVAALQLRVSDPVRPVDQGFLVGPHPQRQVEDIAEIHDFSFTTGGASVADIPTPDKAGVGISSEGNAKVSCATRREWPQNGTSRCG